MKKLLLFIALGLFTLGTQAQDLFLSNYTTNHFGDLNTVIDAHVTIENHGTNTMYVMAERVENNLAAGHLNLFCYGITCYPPSTDISSVPDTILIGGADNSFKSQLLPNQSIGVSNVKYCFYEQSNIADSVCIRFVYSVTAVGIEDVAKNASFSKPSPNPAKGFTAFTYDLQGNTQAFVIEVYNMLGSKVKTVEVAEQRGALLMSTEELENGIYFCSLVSEGKVYLTQKLLVAR